MAEEPSFSSHHGLFFTRPFGSMFGSTGGLFGPAGFTGMRTLLRQYALFQPPSPQTERKGVVIEELSDDHEETPKSEVSINHHIFKHPDDVGTAKKVGLACQSKDQPPHGKSFHALRNGDYQSSDGGLTNSSYEHLSYQSNTMCHGGTGKSYCSFSTQKVGLDGVHVFTKKRDATSRESILTTGCWEPPKKQFKS